MRNIQKAMLAVFCTGVFLTGIGTGIAFSEFSSFDYSGEKAVGDVKLVTETLDYTNHASAENPLRILDGYYYFNRNAHNAMRLIEDETVPENTVRFQVTYNENAVSPYLLSSDSEFDFNEAEDSPYVGIRFDYLQDDLEVFMSCKDQILKDLKERRIGSYRTVTVEKLTVSINPAADGTVLFE